MGYLPPVGWAEVATKRDLDALATLRREDLEETAAVLHTEIASLRHGLHTEIGALRHRFERSLKQMAMWVSSAVIGSAGLAVALNQLLG
jgi:hypothetical protein